MRAFAYLGCCALTVALVAGCAVVLWVAKWDEAP